MTNFNGFFAVVNFNEDQFTTPNGVYDVAGLTFAMVYHEETADWRDRWTTWTLDADALLLYQPTNRPNEIIAGNNSHLYVLDDETFGDDGKSVYLEYQSSPLPELGEEVFANTWKRFQEIWWEIADSPPANGYEVTVRLQDINNPANFNERIVTMYTTRMHVDLTLRCRQAYLSLKLNVGTDFNLTNMGYSFQQQSTKKTTRLH